MKNEDIQPEDLEAAWEAGTPIEVDRSNRSATTVLSIRVPEELLRDLSGLAEEQGRPVGTLARELLQSSVDEQGPVTPKKLAFHFERWVDEFFRVESSFRVAYASPPVSRVLSSSTRVIVGPSSDEPDFNVALWSGAVSILYQDLYEPRSKDRLGDRKGAA